jgi:hypothetical protein
LAFVIMRYTLHVQVSAPASTYSTAPVLLTEPVLHITAAALVLLLLCWPWLLPGQSACFLQLYEWDFSVFELGKQSGGRPLFHVSMALLQDQGLLVCDVSDWIT